MTEKLIEEIISYRHKDLIEENLRLKNEIMQIKQLRTYYTEMYEYGIFHAVSEDELTKELMDANEKLRKIQFNNQHIKDVFNKREHKLSDIESHWAYKLFIKRGLEE